MNSPCLRLANVFKSFGAGHSRNEVLADVNLEVARGEFVAIVGFSGTGKTTLISMIAGLLAPDAGTIELEGKIITGPGPDRGVVFQNYSLLPWLTVQGNIALAVNQVFPSWTAQKRQEHVARYIEMVGLSHARDRHPPQLSGGMRQRVALARALAMSPEVLLLDEPLSALDALTRGSLQTEIERIWRQDRKTVVMITNHVDEAILLADRIIPLTPGPQATLGPAFVVDLPRPRERQAINHDRRFQELRSEITESLLASRKQVTTRTNVAAEAPAFQPMPLSAGKRRRTEPAILV